ncbi:MAG: DNA polymerase III subunit epsilon [Pseudomonadota bacterium]
MKAVYVVTDVEVDGPVPGLNSMLCFASVAISPDGEEIGTFETVIEPLEGAAADEDTMAWFRSMPEVHAAATKNPRRAIEVMQDFTAWILGLPGDPIFAAHPLLMDAPWIDYYLRHFGGYRLLKGPWPGEQLFHAGGLCIRSFASAKLSWPIWECAAENYPPELLGNHEHTHLAIDDARGYACLLAALMSR